MRDVVDGTAEGTNERKLAARAKRASVRKTLARDRKFFGKPGSRPTHSLF